MLALNHRTGTMCDTNKMVKGIVNIENDVCEFGHFSRGHYIKVYYKDNFWPILSNRLLKYCYFDGQHGSYILAEPFRTDRKDVNLKRGRGSFPYSFSQMYEAIHCFNVFKGKQFLTKVEEFDYSKHLNYTFGLEFETSAGYIPEDICLRDGLIPLRDGSISGVEYSTVVLSGNDGVNFLKQQLNTLNKYTVFDKECSLHIHMGLPEVNPYIVWNLYVLATIVQNELTSYVPYWTFESQRYKRTGKNYCQKLPVCEHFDSFYKFIAGERFDGSLSRPHPSDPDRTRKWQISSRYFAFNFVNLLCYESPKTLEFRFLRPTYNYDEIMTWMFVFNSMIKIAYVASKENTCTDYKTTFEYMNKRFGNLFNMIKLSYPHDLYTKIVNNLKLINNAHSIFRVLGDNAGINTAIKENYYKGSKLNKSF